VDLFAGSDTLAPQQDNVGRYDGMNGSKTIYSEMVDIVSRYATGDGEHTTSIDGLIFGRRTSPTQLLHTSAHFFAVGEFLINQARGLEGSAGPPILNI
jgi:hypothetical protein